MDRSVDLNWVRFFIKMNQKEQMRNGRGEAGGEIL